jgi:uncharacterized protein
MNSDAIQEALDNKDYATAVALAREGCAEAISDALEQARQSCNKQLAECRNEDERGLIKAYYAGRTAELRLLAGLG